MDEKLNFECVGQIHESFDVVYEPLRESVSELREPISEPVTEFDSEPKSARELAEYFGVTDRAIQNWFRIVADAYCWLPETNLKTGDGKNTRYLPFTVSLMQALKLARESGQTANDWIIEIQKQAPKPIEQQIEPQPIEAELVDEPTSSMIHVPDVQGLSRLDLAKKRQSDVQNRLTQTLEEFREWDEALKAELTANEQATETENQADFDEKVIDLLLRKKNEQDRLKKLEALIDSGVISPDELLKRYAGANSMGNG